MTQNRFGIRDRLFLTLAIAAVAAVPGTCPATTFTQITADTTKETDPTPSPDGKWILFTSDRAGRGATNLYIMPTEGGQPRQITHEPDSARAGTPSWAPDGKSFLFVSRATTSIPFRSRAAPLASCRARREASVSRPIRRTEERSPSTRTGCGRARSMASTSTSWTHRARKEARRRGR